MDRKQENIFVIDDDLDLVELLSYNLNKAGYHVTSATSGTKALWSLEDDHSPDLILLDLMMPEPNGYEICRYLKSSDDFRKIPLIIVSAKGTQEDIEKGFLLGADAYLPKPFAISTLLELLTCFRKLN